MEYLVHLGVVGSVLFLAGASLRLLAVRGGYVSFAHGCAFAIGAYAVAVGSTAGVAGMAIRVLGGLFLATAFGVLLAAPSLKARGGEFALYTFGIQVVASQVVTNWHGLSGGPTGVSTPWPSFPGPATAAAVFTVCVCLGILVTRLDFTLFDRFARAVRDDEELLAHLSVPSAPVRLTLGALSAVGAALAGAAYGLWLTYVDPSVATLEQSIQILIVAVIGATGSGGLLLGVAVALGIPEALRLLSLPVGVAAHSRIAIYGIILIALPRLLQLRAWSLQHVR